MLVDYSHQAYILSCNDTDYSFFGSLNYQQSGVHVEGIAGHNMAQRTVNDTDTGVGPVTRTRTAKAKVSGPWPSDLPAAERSNRDDDLQGAMMDLLHQQQRTMEALTKELTTRARLEQNRASGPNPQPAATTKARRIELPRLEAPSEVTLTDYNDWKVRFRDYVVPTSLMEEIPSVLGRQAELRAALARPGRNFGKQDVYEWKTTTMLKKYSKN